MEGRQLNIIMYPWLAIGHIIPYFQLGLQLAKRGNKVTLLLTNKAKFKLPSSNFHPLLTLHTINIPHVNPLPLDTQLNSDIPFHLETHLVTAFDLVRPEFETILASIEPNLVFYDFACWIPEVVRAILGSKVKCVAYYPVSAVAIAYNNIPFREPPKDRDVVETDRCIAGAPPGYPCSSKVFLEPKDLLFLYMPYGEGFTFYQRTITAIKWCDAIAIRTTREIEGKYFDFLSSQYNNKPVLCPGIVPTDTNKDVKLDTRWAEWLGQFGPASVVFCSLGSQVVLELAQFQELLLGFEMTNLPFLVALKPPTGYKTVEEAFPEGFMERVRERGFVTGEWVPQPQIVDHPSVGCFVNHCGSGSIWEALLSKNQIVLIPQHKDQELFTKLLVKEFKVAVQVETGDDGEWIAKESLCKAINSVMGENNDIGKLVKTNHEYWRQILARPGLMSDYIDTFIKDLQELID